MPALDPLLAWIAAAGLAALLAHAGLHKLLARGEWLQHLAAYRVPETVLTPLSAALPLIELTLAAGLLSPWRTLAAAGAACVLLAYAAAMAWQLLQGRAVDCGCGGAPLPVSWALVARNLVFVGMAVAAAAATVERPLGWGDFAVVVAAVLLAALLDAALHHLLRHHARRATPSRAAPT